LCKIDSVHLLIWRKIFCFQTKSSVFKKKSSVFRRNLLVWRKNNLLFSSKSFCFQEKIFCFQMISSGRSSDLGKFKVDRSANVRMCWPLDIITIDKKRFKKIIIIGISWITIMLSVWLLNFFHVCWLELQSCYILVIYDYWIFFYVTVSLPWKIKIP